MHGAGFIAVDAADGAARHRLAGRLVPQGHWLGQPFAALYAKVVERALNEAARIHGAEPPPASRTTHHPVLHFWTLSLTDREARQLPAAAPRAGPTTSPSAWRWFRRAGTGTTAADARGAARGAFSRLNVRVSARYAGARVGEGAHRVCNPPRSRPAAERPGSARCERTGRGGRASAMVRER